MGAQQGSVAIFWEFVWRRARPHTRMSSVLVVGSIVGLMVAVTIMRWFVYGAGETVSLFYLLPVAFSALYFGRRGGLIATGCGIAAFVVLELVRTSGDVDVTGWVGPLLAIVLMGGLVGHLSEFAARNKATRSIQEQHLDELRHERNAALETSDSIVQQVAAARWMLEVGKSQEALAALNVTVAEGIGEVSKALPPLSMKVTHDRRRGGDRDLSR